MARGLNNGPLARDVIEVNYLERHYMKFSVFNVKNTENLIGRMHD